MIVCEPAGTNFYCPLCRRRHGLKVVRNKKRGKPQECAEVSRGDLLAVRCDGPHTDGAPFWLATAEDDVDLKQFACGAVQRPSRSCLMSGCCTHSFVFVFTSQSSVQLGGFRCWVVAKGSQNTTKRPNICTDLTGQPVRSHCQATALVAAVAPAAAVCSS